ncbi:MAG: rhodanese-like domain-containing protein [Terracidiphilus sp.]
MNWSSVALVVLLVALYFWFKRAGQISHKDAVQHLKHGAMLIDVRSGAEYIAGHLPNAVNMPLSEIRDLVPRKVKDKERVLLLHCQSGMRSGAARRQLRALGYTNAYNVGSYARAASVVKSR